MGTLEAYEVLEKIGKGSFGIVRKIRRKNDGRELVWKELDYGKMNEKEKKLLVSEVNILRELSHPNIVGYHDRIIDKQKTTIYIVQEFCSGGDLAQQILRARRERRWIDQEDIWKWFTQTLIALNECHNKKEGRVLHRDLKPGNIFLDASGNAKLGDFGLARVMNTHSQFARTYVGTPFYMSPEQIDSRPYSEMSDIWSLGCLIFELCALVPPFEASNHMALYVKIKSGKFGRLPSHYSEEMKQLITRMLNVHQSQRPTVSQLLQHRQIAIRVREQNVTLQLNRLTRKEEQLTRREDEIRQRERAVDARLRRLELLGRKGSCVDGTRDSSADTKGLVRPRAMSVGGEAHSIARATSSTEIHDTLPLRNKENAKAVPRSKVGRVVGHPPRCGSRQLKDPMASKANLPKPSPAPQQSHAGRGLRGRSSSVPNLTALTSDVSSAVRGHAVRAGKR